MEIVEEKNKTVIYTEVDVFFFFFLLYFSYEFELTDFFPLHFNDAAVAFHVLITNLEKKYHKRKKYCKLFAISFSNKFC